MTGEGGDWFAWYPSLSFYFIFDLPFHFLCRSLTSFRTFPIPLSGRSLSPSRTCPSSSRFCYLFSAKGGFPLFSPLFILFFFFSFSFPGIAVCGPRRRRLRWVVVGLWVVGMSRLFGTNRHMTAHCIYATSKRIMIQHVFPSSPMLERRWLTAMCRVFPIRLSVLSKNIGSTRAVVVLPVLGLLV